MMLLRCALLCSLLVACGSPRAKDPGPGSQHEPRPEKPAAPAVAAKPIAIAIVFEGWEVWVGNDQLPVPEHERYPGALRPLRDSFSRVGVTGFPAGSQAMVVTYGERATVRHPMQPIEKLTGAAFGEQKDYADTLDQNLVGGVTLALDELAKVQDARRVLVVIGDGSDTNSETAKGALAELAKRAATEKVEIVTLVYKAQLSSPATVARALDANLISVHGAEQIADQLDWLFTRLKQPPVVAMKGTKPLALAVLFAGAEVWVGNDDFTPANDPSRYEGAFKAIKAAFEKAPMNGLPKGAMVMIATYDSNAKVRLPMTPAERFDTRALGGQRDYYGAIGTELVSGVTMAFTELLKVDAKQRVLVVVGDGADTDNETAKGQLAELAKQAAASHIEVHAIVYKSALSSEGTVVTVLDPYAPTVNSADQITAQLVTLFSRLR